MTLRCLASCQGVERGLLRHRREPVFGGLRCFLRPFDQKPLFRIGFRAPVVAMRRATRTAAKRGRKVPSRPWRHPISFQADDDKPRALLNRNGRMVSMALQALGGCTPTWLARGCGQGLLPRFPDGGVRLHAHDLLQSEWSEIRYEMVCPSHNSHPPIPLPPEPAARSLAESAPVQSLACLETPFSGRHAGFPAGRILAPRFRQI